jgi:hypothetical protein
VIDSANFKRQVRLRRKKWSADETAICDMADRTSTPRAVDAGRSQQQIPHQGADTLSALHLTFVIPGCAAVGEAGYGAGPESIRRSGA